MRQLMDAVTASALVPVVGKSGVGKSSLVQAGLLPLLEKTGWTVETILPRPNLPVALAAALARLSGAPPIVPPSELEAWQDYLSLHGLTAAAKKARKDRGWERAVIVIDQFEEELVRERESDPILRQLGDLRDGGLLTVVLTLRGDSFGRFFESQETFGERLRQNAIQLLGMDRHELTEAIRLPAEWYGLDVTDPLVEKLVEAIRDRVRLANERLLTLGCDERGHETAEVVHEALLRAWNQLHLWLDAERPFRRWRERLREDMRSWRETGDSRKLMTGNPLADAERWMNDRKADLDVYELRFIKASAERRDEQDNHYRTVYGRALARELTHRAESAKDPQLALLYAIKVIELSPDPPADRLVRACLHRLGIAELQAIPRRAALAAAGRFRQRLTLAEWSRGPGPDGRWLLGDPAAGLVVGEDGEARYRAGAAIVMPGPAVVAACTPGGVACLVTEAGQLSLWQLADDSDQAEKLGELNFGVSVTAVAVSDTAQMVVAACSGDKSDGKGDGKIRAFNGRGLSEVAVLSFDGFVGDIDVSTDRWVAALGHDRRLRVWDLVTRDLRCESVTDLGVSRIAFDQDYVMAGEVGTGAVGRFPVRPDPLKSLAQQSANRELTAEELAGLADPFASVSRPAQ